METIGEKLDENLWKTPDCANSCRINANSVNESNLLCRSVVENKAKYLFRHTIDFILSLIPIISWLPKYSPKDCLYADLTTGFTIAILHIPQGIAYALLSGVEAIHGIYISFFPVIIYCIFGTSRHISIGSFAISSVIMGGVVDRIAFSESREVYNSTSANMSIVMTPTPLEVATTACLLTGIIQIIFGCIHLGSLSVLLTDELVSGFTTGVAIHVATAQMSNIFGIYVKPTNQTFLKLYYTWFKLIKQFSQINTVTLVYSIAIFTLLVGFKELFDPWLKKKIVFPFPIDLAIVIATTLITCALRLNENYGVAVVGLVPKGFPQLIIPRLDIIYSVLYDSFILAIIIYAVSLSLAKLYAKRHNYEIKANQELIALGIANAFSSFFQCFPSGAGPARSSLQEAIGGKTQMTGLISSAIILMVMLFLAPLLYHLPKCTLSCIILIALKSLVLQINEFRKLCRNGLKCEAMTWLITFLAVILIDVSIGLFCAIIVSVILILYKKLNQIILNTNKKI